MAKQTLEPLEKNLMPAPVFMSIRGFCRNWFLTLPVESASFRPHK